MSAATRNLAVLNYVMGHASWLYKGASTREAADVPGYFNGMANIMAVGDTITIVGLNGVALRYVASNTQGVVQLGQVT